MCTNHRNPIQCILPPYIADKMMDSKKMTTEVSLDNQLRNYRFHSDRKFFSALSRPNQKIMAVKQVKAAKPKPIIEVHTCAHGYSLPGKLISQKSLPVSKDKDVRNVYHGAKYTWEFYNKIFNRNSIDNKGMALINSVHYGKKYDNAMWNGRQMVYGDGDKITFGSFTLDLHSLRLCLY